ncbi:hypothetical protein CSUI_006465, partial [Cystoisospora suis]
VLGCAVIRFCGKTFDIVRHEDRILVASCVKSCVSSRESK